MQRFELINHSHDRTLRFQTAGVAHAMFKAMDQRGLTATLIDHYTGQHQYTLATPTQPREN